MALTKEEIGARIRARRERLGLTQEEVVAALKTRGLEITAPGYGHWESGRREPKPTTLSIMAEILQCDAAYFLAEAAYAQPLDSDPASRRQILELQEMIKGVLDDQRRLVREEVVRQLSQISGKPAAGLQK